MKDMGFEGVIRGKRVRTTVPDKAQPWPLDKVNRQFRVLARDMLRPFGSMPRAPAGQWMPLNRLSSNASRAPVRCTIPTADRNICRPDTPNAWLLS